MKLQSFTYLEKMQKVEQGLSYLSNYTDFFKFILMMKNRWS